MAEKILSITEVDSFDSQPDNKWGGFMEGVLIETDKQTIKVLIDNQSSCCEHWGYLISEDEGDDRDYYIGAELTGVSLTDTNLQTTEFTHDWCNAPKDAIHLDSGDVMFVNIETNLGTLQVAVYNAHNGYYGHGVLIDSKQLKEECYL